MIFSLETLQAKHGDCLIVHYGDAANPKIMVIDGGPGGIYESFLRPRLLNLRESLCPGEPLPLSMVMVSHMDDDHVNGILDLTGDLREAETDGRAPDFDIQHFWFNAFDDIVGNHEIPQVSSLSKTATAADVGTRIPSLAGLDRHVAAVIASTGQGRQLRDDAELFGLQVNSPFSPPASNRFPLVRGDTDESSIDWDDNLVVSVLHPNHQRLVEMQEKWDKDLKEAAEKGDDSVVFASLSKRDDSPFNLASIVCLAELGGKRMLLTGDARGDDIIDGLRRAGLLDQHGKINVDILKIPHHGSDRNVSREFFETVNARHYVISGNGEYGNPDRSTLVMLSDARRGNNDFTVHLTNREGKHNLKAKLDSFIAAERSEGRDYGFEFREDTASSMMIDLLDPPPH